MTPHDVIQFWRQAGPQKWFATDAAFDEAIRQRFGTLHADAVAGRLNDWEKTPEGALALILVLDQFSRNLFRGDARAFAQDGAAHTIAERAIAQDFDKAFPILDRRFFYLPFMHAEDLSAQQRSLDLYRVARDAEGERFARLHYDVIARFGRFPRRNAALRRASTAAEQAYLDQGGAF